MAEKHGADAKVIYRIEVQGALDERWSEWFGGLAVEASEEGGNPPITTLTGLLDQAALRGVLTRIWDLGLELVSVAPDEARQYGGCPAAGRGSSSAPGE
jgi:hypothetical protein